MTREKINGIVYETFYQPDYTKDFTKVKKEFHAFTDYRAELMDAVDEGRISPELMIISLIKYMSQDDVKDCLKINGLLEDSNNDYE